VTDQDRVWLAVDVASLWEACRTCHGRQARINFEVLRDVVVSIRGCLDTVEVTASAYIVTHKRNTHGTFQDVLDSLEYHVKPSQVEYAVAGDHPVSVHDDWTSGITVDAMHWLDHYDTFVLAAGTKQFEKLLTYLQSRGKNVIVLTFESPAATALYEDYADEVFYLTKDIVY
jgi:hypothetical protein